MVIYVQYSCIELELFPAMNMQWNLSLSPQMRLSQTGLLIVK